VAAYFADNDRSVVTLLKYSAVNATFVHYNITLLTSTSVRILQNWRPDWDCTVQQSDECFERLVLLINANMKA